MLKSKLTFFIQFLTFCLLVASLVFIIQEADYYVGAENLWKADSWNFSGK
jgi:hypothetical protein